MFQKSILILQNLFLIKVKFLEIGLQMENELEDFEKKEVLFYFYESFIMIKYDFFE
jgi:hypothetical protein